MDEKELKEIFRELEEQGWEPQLCDTPVPYYENAVMCGDPTDVGDMICGMEMYPKDFFDNQNEFMTTVKGDSMIGANIFEGDRVKVRASKTFADGDILLLSIDGEYTLKGFFRDTEGRPWLIPKNPAYKAFSPLDHQSVKVRGVVVDVIHSNPRLDFRSCMKAVNEAKKAEVEIKPIAPEQVSKAIRQIAPMVKVGRQWYAVYRAMVDAGVMKMDDFDTFCTMIQTLVPTHERLPQSDELQRMAVDSFRKTVTSWKEDDAPVSGKRFKEYLEIAKQTKAFLNNC